MIDAKGLRGVVELVISLAWPVATLAALGAVMGWLLHLAGIPIPYDL